MRNFKFFKNNNKRTDVCEEIALGMIHRCYIENIDCIGYRHDFVMTTLTGVHHSHIIIRDVRRYDIPNRITVVIDYDYYLDSDNTDIVIKHSFGIPENEFNAILEIPRMY